MAIPNTRKFFSKIFEITKPPSGQVSSEEHLPCEFTQIKQINVTSCWMLRLDLIFNGIENPTYLTHAGDGSNRLFLVIKTGVIQIIKDHFLTSHPFLDLKNKVNAKEEEQGLLSIAFHPKYKQNGFFYVAYTDNNNTLTISRFTVNNNNPDAAEQDSEKVILTVRKNSVYHNGGYIVFGPDGYLYIGIGDDTNSNNVQNKKMLTGKILRIDVNSDQLYAIPEDNPFVHTEYRPEIYALGLRNPWRFSIDKETGNVFIADVGENRYEELNIMNISTLKGSNFGWPYFEGNHRTNELYKNNLEKKHDFDFEDLPLGGGDSFVNPTYEYHHVKKTDNGDYVETDEDDEKACTGSIIGGYVYRGNDFPQMRGYYFFTDFCTGTIYVLFRYNERFETAILNIKESYITSFGEDEKGELYVVSNNGGIYKLIAHKISRDNGGRH